MPKDQNTILLDQLSGLERLASGAKWKRFVHHPYRLAETFLHRKMAYPKTKKGLRRKSQTFWGDTMEVLLPAGTDIYLLGTKSHDSEIRLAKYLIQNLKSGMTFFDVGAHFGFYSLLASHLVGETGRVLGFEPAPNTFALYRDNVKNAANITAHNVAIGKEKGKIAFYEFPLLQSEFNTLNPDQYLGQSWYKPEMAKRVEVELLTLDDFAKEHLPNIVKVDVEGAEDQVVSGIDYLLEKQTSHIVLEYHFGQKKEEEAIHAKAARFLLQKGYQANLIQANGELKPLNKFPQVENITVEASENIVFSPA